MTQVWCREISETEDQSLAARSLLAMLFGEVVEVRHDGAGKPYLPGGPEISLSHTKGAVAAAVSRKPVGVDVERLRPIRPKMPRRVLSDPEYAWFRSRGEQPEDFLTLWTLKESYYKYLGTGLTGIPNQTEFYLEKGIWRLRGAAQRFFVWRNEELLIALCGDEQSVEFRWC